MESLTRRARLFLPLALCLLLGAQAAVAETPEAAPAPKVASSAPAKAKHVVGDRVMIAWGGSWWTSSVIAVLTDGRLVIHYDGWGNEWDELVNDAARVRTEVQGPSSYKVGDAAFVEWKGSWWPAKVTAVAKGGYAIHYDGYGPEWDEVVAPSRMKRMGPPEG